MYGKEFHSLDSWNLQPPMPRPNTFSVKYTTCSAIPAPHSSCIPKFPLSPLNQHLVGISSDQQNKTDINTETIVSSRWNPTPEQLEALEEMYRGGTTTPSSEQIQQIAENLRRFGKIEGKNVFYWFQNHKSRRRQKRRRHFESSRGKPLRDDIVNFQTKESGLSSTGIQVEETKNWETPSNCSTLSQEYVSIQGQAAAGNKLHDRIQFEERELHKRNSNRIAKHATWQVIELPSSTAPMASALNRASFINQDDEIENSQTLELFPLWHEDHDDANIIKNDDEMTMTNMITNFTPIQFFEFLPIKN